MEDIYAKVAGRMDPRTCGYSPSPEYATATLQRQTVIGEQIERARSQNRRLADYVLEALSDRLFGQGGNGMAAGKEFPPSSAVLGELEDTFSDRAELLSRLENIVSRLDVLA